MDVLAFRINSQYNKVKDKITRLQQELSDIEAYAAKENIELIDFTKEEKDVLKSSRFESKEVPNEDPENEPAKPAK
jgi:hypothetical protein